MLVELELPRLLAPDLPSNGSSLKDLKCAHSDYQASDESGIVIFRHYLGLRPVGNLRACCLP